MSDDEDAREIPAADETSPLWGGGRARGRSGASSGSAGRRDRRWRRRPTEVSLVVRKVTCSVERAGAGMIMVLLSGVTQNLVNLMPAML